MYFKLGTYGFGERDLVDLISPVRLMAPKLRVNVTGLPAAAAEAVKAATTPALSSASSADFLNKHCLPKCEANDNIALYSPIQNHVRDPQGLTVVQARLDYLKLFTKYMITVDTDAQLRQLEEALEDGNVSTLTCSADSSTGLYKHWLRLKVPRFAATPERGTRGAGLSQLLPRRYSPLCTILGSRVGSVTRRE